MQTARNNILAAFLLLTASAVSSFGEWPTSRGNFERTGNPEGTVGPRVPRVLWVYKAKEHFVASPTPSSAGIFTSALGAYNTGLFRCLSLKTDPSERVLWSKSSPFIKRPTVCSPAVASGLVIFGDGMHQTDDAWLYALKADTGRLVWQLPVPGKLVHLEAPPTVDGAYVYVCGGAAGVICLSLDKVTIGKEEMDLPQAQERLEKAWTEIKAKYEVERAKHPDFAIPPDEDALPKPAPRIRWQKGKDSWHVDAPVAVAGRRVFVASCFIDEENVGKRALFCLKVDGGEQVWEAPLQINPWAGPTVAGNTIFVAGSTIRFDPAALRNAGGDVAAFDCATGQPKWRQAVPGAVLSPVAVSNNTVLFTATDGKLRAHDAGTGAEKWVYDAGKPFFAGPALAGQVVYVVDLKGTLHAVSAKDGQRLWILDVPSAPEVFASGMVYGSPVVSDGRIYIGTCNVHGGGSDDAGVIVCIADETVKAREAAAVRIDVDTARRMVTIPCRIAPRKLPFLAEIYPLEVVASFPAPAGQKAHETVVTFDARPSDVRSALLKLGLKEGKPTRGDSTQPPTGDELRLYLELPLSADSVQTVPIESLVVDARTGKSLPGLKWFFTGSTLRQPDPEKDTKVFGADASGTLATIFPVSDETVIQSSLLMSDRRLLRLETNRDVIPPEGTDARLIIFAGAAAYSGPDNGKGAAQPLLSWMPPPMEALSRMASLATDLVPFDGGVNGLAPAEWSAGPRSLPATSRTVVRLGQSGIAPLFRETERITLPKPPPMAAGLPAKLRKNEVAIPIALPERVLQAGRQSTADLDTPAVGPETAVFRAAPLQRQTVAPRIVYNIPDPSDTAKCLRMEMSIPDSDPAVPPPNPPAVTNLAVSTPRTKDRKP